MSGKYKRIPTKEFDNETLEDNTFFSPHNRDHGQIQNSKTTTHYVFGNDAIFEDEKEDVLYEMPKIRSRGRGDNKEEGNGAETVEQTQEELYLERRVQEGDTLQNIALKYGCPVSELKRINNLIKDQDFFALVVIKVPIKRHGLLSELLESEKESGCKLTKPAAEIMINEANCDDDNSENSDGERQNLLVRTLSIRGVMGKQSKEAANFLKRMDRDLANLRQASSSRKETLEEVTHVLTSQRIHPLRKRTSFFGGTDCGIRWWSVLIIFIVIALVVPIVVILYNQFFYSSDDSSSSNS